MCLMVVSRGSPPTVFSLIHTIRIVVEHASIAVTIVVWGNVNLGGGSVAPDELCRFEGQDLAILLTIQL